MTLRIGSWVIRRRNAFLALMGIVWLLVGYSYLSLTPAEVRALRKPLRLAVDLAPLWVFGVAWTITGALALIDGLNRGLRSTVGYTAAVIMPTLWALLSLGAWLNGDQPRGWVSALVYAALAGAIIIVAGMPVPVIPETERLL